jgi:DNA-binding transcriptional MerR regulator
MKLFHRHTKLETLQKELGDLELQIKELKQDLAELRGETTPINSVVYRFLKLHLGFNYAVEKEALDRLVRQKETFLKELEKEKSRIEAELQTLWEKERLRAMKIRFEGQGVLDSDGSICRIQCQNCKNVYTHDFKLYGAFDNILACQSQNELQFLYNRGINVFEVKCPKCNASVVVKVFRSRV